MEKPVSNGVTHESTVDHTHDTEYTSAQKSAFLFVSQLGRTWSEKHRKADCWRNLVEKIESNAAIVLKKY